MPMFDSYPRTHDEALPLPEVIRPADMPSTPREEEQPQRKHRRRKEHERDRDSNSSKDKQRSSQNLNSPKLRKRRSGSKERERERDTPRSSTSDRGARKAAAVVVPEMERRPSSGDVSAKSSYPTFSKAHSREAVGSREDVRNVRSGTYTPEATEVGAQQEKERRRNSTPANGMNAMPSGRPPSPPLTVDDPDIKRSGSSRSMGSATAEVRSGMENGRKSMESTPRTFAAKNRSTASLQKEARFGESDISSMPGAFPEDERRSTPNSGYRRTVSTGSQPASVVTDTTAISQSTGTDSDATSVAPDRKATRSKRPPDIATSQDASPASITDSQPKTPTPQEQTFPMHTKAKIIDVGGANAYQPKAFGGDLKTPMTAIPAPPPPPPPPVPAAGSKTTPRVDYLMKNGGLRTMIPRRLVQSGPAVQTYATYQSPAIGSMAPLEEYARIFSPLHQRLDDYLNVLRHNGSLAVATGYKSVARRLLDKLSQVFARDISSQRCDCVLCKTIPQPILSDEEDSGVSWGEILEFVSGRRELPQWPPFSIAPDDSGGLGISTGGMTQVPMQKLDIDVPEEYKDHYIRQNQKTKKAVQSWLAQQPEFPSSPPDEADEDTLMFAMMTKLTLPQRNALIALMHGQASISSSRAPTPAERPATSSDALRRARKALQRLYRLDRPPRDCESAMYLLNNSPLHGMLATLAEVNEQEWDILVSGRFDGFLWSGAEAPWPPSASAYNSPVASRGPSRGPNPFSRNTTPFSGMSALPPSRNQTPFSPLRNVMDFGSSDNGSTPQQQHQPTHGMFPSPSAPPAPVQMDEDTEIAVLAEVERNLFNDMERFEDAFEILHSRAELVRGMLRERGAGLSMASQARRGSEVGVRLGTPATDFEDEDGEGLGEDDGMGGDVESLAPDDSASQISVNRRQKRRERRGGGGNVGVVAEEDESAFEEEIRSKHGGRRSKY